MAIYSHVMEVKHTFYLRRVEIQCLTSTLLTIPHTILIGISPKFESLEDIEKLYRFVEPEADSAILDILWSDPIPEEDVEEMTDEEYETFMNLEWRPNPSRGCSYTYGYKAIRQFLGSYFVNKEIFFSINVVLI